MRTVLIGLATLTMILPASIELASAQPRPWCLQAGRGGPGGGLPDCSYHTLQQCRGAVTDGCMQNPALGWDRIEGKRARQPAPSTSGRGY